MLKKSFRIFAAGILVGGICSFSFQGFASQTGNVVTAFIDNLVRFEINGEIKSLPRGYNVLNYGDRIYVPIRFVGEEMGADVEWDSNRKVVGLDFKKGEEIAKEAKPEDTKCEENSNVETRVYKKPTISKESLEMLIGVAAVTEDNKEWKVHVVLENKRSTPLQLLQSEIKIEVDNIEYSMSDVHAYKLDNKWYNDVREDQKREGFIILPKIHKNPENLHMVITVVENNHTQKKHEIEFNISLEGVEKE